MAKNPEVDQELCIGCGLCTNIAPDCFEMDEDNKAFFNGNEDCSDDDIEEAIAECPVEAITR